MKKIKIKNYYILTCILCLNLLLQSCCDKGNLYHYFDKDDYFAYNIGDTVLYTNETADTEKYVIASVYREVVETGTQPEDCYSYEYSELEMVSYKKINSKNDSNRFSIKPPNEFGIIWNGNYYLNNQGHEHLDSIILNNIIYRKIHKFGLHKQIIVFNYKYGVIQYADSLKQLWTIYQP